MFGFSERHRFEPDAAGDSGFDERSGRPLRPEAMSWPKCPLPNSQVRARRTPFRLRGRTGQNSGVRNENLRVRKDFACNGNSMSGAYDIDTLSCTVRTARARVPIRPPQPAPARQPLRGSLTTKRTLLTDAYAATAVPAPVRSPLSLCACASPACLALGSAEHSSATAASVRTFCPEGSCFDPGVTPGRRRRRGCRTSAGRRRSSSISWIADQSLAGPSSPSPLRTSRRKRY